MLSTSNLEEAEAATFTVTPAFAAQGETLRFQAVMNGEPSSDPIADLFVAGNEQAEVILINPDRTTDNPGGCVGHRDLPGTTWGVDIDITGPDADWAFQGTRPEVCEAALSPGNYIVTFQYSRAVGDGTTTLHSIDALITIYGDRDSDGIDDPDDNCPDVPNADQADTDNDGIGAVCDSDENDRDEDGIPNDEDNCPDEPNFGQEDWDEDGLGDLCDPNPFDRDNDGVNDILDNCPTVFNPTQDDSDGNNVGDACEPDIDNDGVPNVSDNCPLNPNPDQLDTDLTPDGLGDVCDPPDSDGDGHANVEDNCPSVANPDQKDANADSEGDACDLDDSDGDGVEDSSDNCPSVPNPDQANSDNDNLGDLCEMDDSDGDGHANIDDNCPFNFNPGQFDQDSDGIGDVCDPDYDPEADRDTDQDGLNDDEDNCFLTFNPGQEDSDGDGIGNACEVPEFDSDDDGLTDSQEDVLGTDPNDPTPMSAGITSYSEGELTGSSNPVTSGDEVGVVVNPPSGVTAVEVMVTDPDGDTAVTKTLIPQSPVVFSFTPDEDGVWSISAELFAGTVLVDTFIEELLVSDPPVETDDPSPNDANASPVVLTFCRDGALHTTTNGVLTRLVPDAPQCATGSTFTDDVATAQATPILLPAAGSGGTGDAAPVSWGLLSTLLLTLGLSSALLLTRGR